MICSSVVSVYSSRARAVYSVPRKSTTNPPNHSILVQHVPLNPSHAPNHPSYPSTTFNTLYSPLVALKALEPCPAPTKPHPAVTCPGLASTPSAEPHRPTTILDGLLVTTSLFCCSGSPPIPFSRSFIPRLRTDGFNSGEFVVVPAPSSAPHMSRASATSLTTLGATPFISFL